MAMLLANSHLPSSNVDDIYDKDESFIKEEIDLLQQAPDFHGEFFNQQVFASTDSSASTSSPESWGDSPYESLETGPNASIWEQGSEVGPEGLLSSGQAAYFHISEVVDDKTSEQQWGIAIDQQPEITFAFNQHNTSSTDQDEEEDDDDDLDDEDDMDTSGSIPSFSPPNQHNNTTPHFKGIVASLRPGQKRPRPANAPPTSIERQVNQKLKLSLKEEELAEYDLEELSQRVGVELTKADERELKRLRRKVRNKMSAANSRQKKREYVTSLEEQLENVSTVNETLLHENKNLLAENEKLRVQVAHLQNLLDSNMLQQPATSNPLLKGKLRGNKGTVFLGLFFMFTLYMTGISSGSLPTLSSSSTAASPSPSGVIGRNLNSVPTSSSLPIDGVNAFLDKTNTMPNWLLSQNMDLSDASFPNNVVLATDSFYGPLLCTDAGWCEAIIDFTKVEQMLQQTTNPNPKAMHEAFIAAYDGGVTNFASLVVNEKNKNTPLRDDLLSAVQEMDRYAMSVFGGGVGSMMMNVRCSRSHCLMEVN